MSQNMGHTRRNLGCGLLLWLKNVNSVRRFVLVDSGNIVLDWLQKLAERRPKREFYIQIDFVIADYVDFFEDCQIH